VEQPGGDPSRNTGPFYHDQPHPERSLYWFAYNSSKRSITLDITKADGKEVFKRLVETADFLLECFPPGYMEGLGLGYSTLSEINPRLIMLSITPFGQSGPYRDYKSCDLVAQATGGLMWICGDEDRAPVHVPHHANAQAGLQAAVALLIANSYRELTGEGQYIDLSFQEALLFSSFVSAQHWDLNRYLVKRHGISMDQGPPLGIVPQIMPCQDGYMAGIVGGPDIKAVAQWLDSEGMAQDLMEKSYTQEDAQAPVVLQISPEERQHIREVVIQWMKHHTRKELYEGASRRRIRWLPVNTARDVYEDPQLEARDYFARVEHPELGQAVTYLGPPFRATEMASRITRRPPRIGEHNSEVFEKELGISKEKLALLKQAGVI
jgi:crotonobetainyl-CoA:carnitine CoA-transferase CaiB-like acyl-CoA transferase